MESSVQILGQLSELLNRTDELAGTLTESLRLLAQLVELDCGWVWLRTAQEKGYYLAASWSLPQALVDPEQMTGKSCYCLDAFRKGELPRQQVTVMECSRLKERSGKIRYHATLPLVFDGRPLGIINLAGPDWRRLTEQESRWLSLAARQIGLAVERHQLAREKMTQVRDQERVRLARNVHDHLAQSFTAITLQSEAGLLLESEASPHLERILEIARRGLEQARSSVEVLRRGAPLAGRLRAECERFTYRTGIPVKAELEPDLTLWPAFEEELVAVLCEGLANIERHARAHRVQLAVGTVDELLEFELSDDGVGFEPTETPLESFGLRGIGERVELMGGQLQVESEPGKGTSILVQLAPR